MWSQVGLRNHHINKTSGGDGIQVELFQILKDNAVKVLHSICQQIWKIQQWKISTGLENVSFHSKPKERQCQRISNYHTVELISHTGKVMLKILQARLQQYVNCELPDVQAEFRKGRGTRNQTANIYFCFIDYAKTLTLWTTINCEKFLKRWEYQTTWPASWVICM